MENGDDKNRPSIFWFLVKLTLTIIFLYFFIRFMLLP